MNPQQILYDILHRTTPCYMTIRPSGIDLGSKRKLLPAIDCKILNFMAEKTLYRKRRLVCRLMNSANAFDESKGNCRQCLDRHRCIDLIGLDLLFENRRYRLCLAHRSAKNFLIYTSKIVEQKIEIHTIDTKLVVVNRGSWGELRFYRADITPSPEN